MTLILSVPPSSTKAFWTTTSFVLYYCSDKLNKQGLEKKYQARKSLTAEFVKNIERRGKEHRK